MEFLFFVLSFTDYYRNRVCAIEYARVMNLSEGEEDDCHEHLYAQMKHCNLMNEKQQTWRPMDGVGQLSDEHFVGNFMADASQQSVGHCFFQL